jgi:outer membrane protein
MHPVTTRRSSVRTLPACLLRLVAPILFLSFVIGPAVGVAQTSPAPAEPLTLRDAMRRARTDARQVTAAAARLTASEAQLRQARGHRLPTIKLEEVWIYTDSPADVFGLQLSQEVFSFADFVASDPNHPDFFDNALSRLELSLPLYAGGEIATRIRQAELGAEAASSRAAWTGNKTALAAAEAYIRLAQVREQVGLLERSLETVQAHADRARAYEGQGMLVSSERLRAEVEVARLEDELTQARGRARVAEAALSFRLNTDPRSRWELEPLPAPEPLGGELDTWLAEVEGRADLEAARRQVKAAELEAQAALAGRKPRFGLAVREDFYDEWPFGDSGNNTSVIVQGTFEVFAGGRHRAAEAKARAEAKAAAEDVARFTEGAQLALRDAWEAAVTARERHATARAALKAAQETERITEARFEKGVVQMIDLLDATTARREAETRELVARADARLATVQLYHQAGRGPEAALTDPAVPEQGTPEETQPEETD